MGVNSQGGGGRGGRVSATPTLTVTARSLFRYTLDCGHNQEWPAKNRGNEPYGSVKSGSRLFELM